MGRKQKNSYSLNDFLKYPNLTLRIGSFKPFNQKNTKFSLAFRVSMITGPIATIFIFIGYASSLFTINDESIPFINQISNRGSATGFSAICVAKMGLMFYYRKDMAKLVTELAEYFPGKMKLNECISNCEYKLKELHDFSIRQMRPSFIFLSCAAIFLTAIAMGQSVFTYCLIGQYIYELPTDLGYPYDDKSLLMYIVYYGLEIYSTIHFLSFYMAGDYMLCFFLTQARMHYEFLVTVLETVDAVELEKDPDCLRFLIRYHVNINRMFDRINEIFDVSILINFSTTSIGMCLMGYSLLTGLSFSDYMIYSMALIIFMSFTLVICYNGHKLTESTEKLFLATFYHNWYDAGPLHQKMILMFMTGSKKPCILQAYKFLPVSMETFKNMVKFSYELFTFFKAM